MKTILLKKSLYFFSLLCLLSSNMFASENPTESRENVEGPVTSRPKFVCEFETPTEFMQAFLDTSKKPEKSFIWWAAQMILLCQKDPRLKKFTVQLGQAAKGNPEEPKIKRADIVSKLFIQYQMYFSQELQAYILKTGLQKVFAAMKKRAEK